MVEVADWECKDIQLQYHEGAQLGVNAVSTWYTMRPSTRNCSSARMLMLNPTIATRTGRWAAAAGGTPAPAPAAGTGPMPAPLGTRALPPPPPTLPNSWTCTWRWIPPKTPGGKPHPAVTTNTTAPSFSFLNDKQDIHKGTCQ